jgi:glyoxylase-like metal-dependent hydrolase (beta-lactamase superfamily II)
MVRREATLVEIEQAAPGFNGFIGSWVCRDGITLLVDVGPSSTSSRLIRSLDALGVREVDYVLLTHIHIDHAGALADVLARYPGARVLCHEKGIEFLVDPTRLWAGSKKVLGKIAEGYGEPKPVSRDRLIPHTQNPLESVAVIETPGHAPHHLSFTYDGGLYAGEAAGNYLVVDGREYLRPPTPPRFFFDVFVESVERLLVLEDQPIYYAHFGRAESSRRMLKAFKDQLFRWKEVISDQLSLGEEGLAERCIAELLEKDANLQAFPLMGPDAQKRERTLMANAVNGFIGFLQGK